VAEWDSKHDTVFPVHILSQPEASRPLLLPAMPDAMQKISFKLSRILQAKWRATVDEDGHYAFAVAL